MEKAQTSSEQPHYWRPAEVMAYLNERLAFGYKMDDAHDRYLLKMRFYYLQRIGIIPHGTEQSPVGKRGRSGGIAQAFTDEQVEEIVCRVRNAIQRPEDL